MNRQQILMRGIVLSFVISLLSGCGGASPTPSAVSIPTSTAIPALPPPVVPRATATAIPVTATTTPTAATDGEATLPPAPSATLQERIDRPFLMRIDRISVIVGRGTLLEGRVANGTLQANDTVVILSPQNPVQNTVLSPTVLAMLISNIGREQLTVGDYAGILVRDIKATDLSPGMLLAKAGQFNSYEEALRQLQ